MKVELALWIPLLAGVLALAGYLVARTRMLVWLPALVLVMLALFNMAPHHWKKG